MVGHKICFNGEIWLIILNYPCYPFRCCYIENTKTVPFDFKFMRREQKQCRNTEAWRASPTCFWLTLTWFSIYHTFLADLMEKGSEANEKQMQFSSNLLMSQMHYDVTW